MLNILLWPFRATIRRISIIFMNAFDLFKKKRWNFSDVLDFIPVVIITLGIGVFLFSFIQFLAQNGYSAKLALIKQYSFANPILTNGGTVKNYYQIPLVIAVLVFFFVETIHAIVALYKKDKVWSKIIFSFVLVFGIILPLLPIAISEIQFYKIASSAGDVRGKYNQWIENNFLIKIVTLIDPEFVTSSKGIEYRDICYFIGYIVLAAIVLVYLFLLIRKPSSEIAANSLTSTVGYFGFFPLILFMIENIFCILYIILVTVVIVGFTACGFGGGFLGAAGSNNTTDKDHERGKIQTRIKGLQTRKAGYEAATRERLKGTVGYGYIDPEANLRVIKDLDTEIKNLEKKL